MHLLVETIVLGLLSGAVYCVSAAGLSLIFGVLRVVNFAHGALGMLGGYSAYYAGSALGLPPIITLLVALLAGGAVGYLVSVTLLRPLAQGTLDRPSEYAIVATFALSELLVAGATVVFGGDFHLPSGLWNRNLSVGTWVHVSGDSVVGLIAAAIVLAALFWIVYRTDTGRAWRAITQNRRGAEVVGIPIPRMTHLAFATAGALAAVGAALLAPLSFIYPTAGDDSLVAAFVVVVIGGLGSIPGVIVGGLALGLVQELGASYVASSYQEGYGFVIMILILLVWPNGIFGRSARLI